MRTAAFENGPQPKHRVAPLPWLRRVNRHQSEYSRQLKQDLRVCPLHFSLVTTDRIHKRHQPVSSKHLPSLRPHPSSAPTGR